MAIKVIFSVKAESEIVEAYDYYELKQLLLGDKFVSCVELAADTISENPEAFPKKLRNYREYLVPVFPYLLIYEYIPEKKLIYILSVFHTSRNPDDKISKK
jgi:plasmid stabilization system protein ParE